MKKVIFTAAMIASVAGQAFAESPSFSQQQNGAKNAASDTQGAIDIKKAKAAVQASTAEIDAKLNSLFTGKVSSEVVAEQFVVGAVEFAAFAVAVPAFAQHFYNIGDAASKHGVAEAKQAIKDLQTRKTELENLIAKQAAAPVAATPSIDGKPLSTEVSAEVKELERIVEQQKVAEAKLANIYKTSTVKAGVRYKIVSRNVQGVSVLLTLIDDGGRVYIVSELGRDPRLSPVLVVSRAELSKIDFSGAIENVKKSAQELEQFAERVADGIVKMWNKEIKG